MMRILWDTNVILDVLLKREPWVKEASVLWQANDESQIIGYMVASTLTDIFYGSRRAKDLNAARTAVRLCLEAFEICPVDRQTLEQADSLPGNDFEDNLQIACAALGGLDAIVTRDKDDFKGSPVPILTPTEMLAQLETRSRKGNE